MHFIHTCYIFCVVIYLQIKGEYLQYRMLFDKTMEEVKYDMEHRNDIILLDVRRDDEFLAGHIPHAVHIPLDVLCENITYAKDQIIYIYCRSGQRSGAACRKLKAMGYENVFNVGGIIHWPYEIEA